MSNLAIKYILKCATIMQYVRWFIGDIHTHDLLMKKPKVKNLMTLSLYDKHTALVWNTSNRIHYCIDIPGINGIIFIVSLLYCDKISFENVKHLPLTVGTSNVNDIETKVKWSFDYKIFSISKRKETAYFNNFLHRNETMQSSPKSFNIEAKRTNLLENFAISKRNDRNRLKTS